MGRPGEKRRFSGGHLSLCDRAGLTLLEVLLAMAILGIGLAVIMQGLALGLKVRRESIETQAMSQVAENRLNELLGEGSFSAAAEGTDGPYLWRLEELPAVGGAETGSAGRLARLKINVEAPSGRTWELYTIFPRGDDEP
jgi:prepilin-type N-terminal cleavage/methylation domain-containing protein